MKFFYIFSGLVLSCIAFVFWALFTFTGNDFLKPYLEQILTKKVGKSVLLETFTLKTNFIDAQILIEPESHLIINGALSLANQSFDLEYSIDSKDLKTNLADIQGILKLQGKVRGTVENFALEGSGVAFASDVVFSSLVQNKNISAFSIKAKGVKIENVLAFANYPPYSKGVFDINADITIQADGSYSGDLISKIHYGNINNALLARDFNISLAQPIIYQGLITSNIQGQQLNLKSNIITNIGQIDTKNSTLNLKSKEFYTDYTLLVPNLSVLNTLSGTTLAGSIQIDGNIKKERDDLVLNASTNTLGGTLKALLHNNGLKIEATDLDLIELTKMLQKPSYSEGTLEGTLELADYRADSRDGNIRAQITGAKIKKEVLKSAFDIDANEDIWYTLKTQGKFKNKNITTDTNLQSAIASLELPQSKINTALKTLDGEYWLHVADLGKLEFITNRALVGTLDLNGTFHNDAANMLIDGNSNFLDAKTSFELKNDIFRLNSTELSTLKLSDMLAYPRVFASSANLSADYNLTGAKGLFAITADDGRLTQNELSNIVKLASGFDLSQQIYKESVLKGTIEQKVVDFDLNLVADQSSLAIPNGKIDLDKNSIQSTFAVNIDDKDFQGSITGDLKKPKVSLDSSTYIKQKIEKAIDKNIPKDMQEPIKNFLNLFG